MGNSSNYNAKVTRPTMHAAKPHSSDPELDSVRHDNLPRRVGFLRSALAFVVLLCLPMAFFSTAEPVGWETIPSYVVPGLVVCIVWALPFDILMSRIFLLGSGDPDYRHRHRSIVLLDLGMLIALLIFWGPFFLNILKR